MIDPDWLDRSIWSLLDDKGKPIYKIDPLLEELNRAVSLRRWPVSAQDVLASIRPLNTTEAREMRLQAMRDAEEAFAEARRVLEGLDGTRMRRSPVVR